jgi:transcriptional regulator with XRE-family HTH domain
MKTKLKISKRIDPKTLLVWRERMGYSQRDACEALGCSREAWIGWETGRHKVPLYIGLACSALALSMKPMR